MREPHRIPFKHSAASILLTAGAIAAGAGTQSVAYAAEGDVEGIQEVVVTAQRREQSIQDVGIAVSALSSDQLHDLQIHDSNAIVASVPGVTYDNDRLSIRGVSLVDFSRHQESPNAVYVDDIYVASTTAAAFALYDLARVEVLRGPQGTLFGRNSTGGLVQYITEKPSATPSGYADIEYGSWNEFRFEGAFGGPINDFLRGRVSVLSDNSDGWIKNTLPDYHDGEGRNFKGIRLQLAADLAPDFTALLQLSYNKDDVGDGLYYHHSAYVDGNGATQILPRNVNYYGTGPGADPLGYVGPTDPYTGAFQDFHGSHKKASSATLRLDGKVGEISIASLTNYNKFDASYLEDCDATPIDACRYSTLVSQKQWSQELRAFATAGRVNWTAGVFALGIDGDYDSTFSTPIFEGTSFDFHVDNPYEQKTRSYAGFAQTEIQLLDPLTAIVGARITHEKKTFHEVQYNLADPANPVTTFEFDQATVGNLTSLSHTDWAGKFELDYKQASGLLFYASVNRGIRGGGFNAVPTSPFPTSSVRFSNESVLAYEVGTKTELFDGRGHFNLSAFHYNYTNFQAFNFAGFVAVTANFPATMTGGEMELKFRPAHGLDLLLTGSVLDAKVKNFFTQGAIREVRPINAPKWTAKAIVRKQWQIGQGAFAAQYDFSGVGRNFYDLNNAPLTSIPMSFTQNFRLSYDLKNWEVYAACENLANRARKVAAYDLVGNFGSVVDVYAPRRRFSLGVRTSL